MLSLLTKLATAPGSGLRASISRPYEGPGASVQVSQLRPRRVQGPLSPRAAAPRAPAPAGFLLSGGPYAVRQLGIGAFDMACQPPHQFGLDAHDEVGGGAVAVEFLSEGRERHDEVLVGGDVL